MNWRFRSKKEISKHDPDMIIDHLLNLRGITHKESFLNPNPHHLHDPYKLKNIKEASIRIISAIKNREKIMIYGDYDADGISAVSLLYIVLKKLNADVGFYLPSRMEEGYGLNEDAIKQIKNGGTDLIITVDCGINDLSEISLAKKLGMDIIVTDHHTPEVENPHEFVINPKLSCDYPYPDLAGVGVAFKLCEGIEKISDLSRNFLLWNLDLVALGTVADVMPLTGENRVITSLGLKIMNERRRPGINATLNTAGQKGEIKAHHIGFIIGPRINALGRLDEALEAVEILITYNNRKVKKLAQTLENCNKKRKQIQKQILQEALQHIQTKDIPANKSGIVLSAINWHEGVIGIVSSKIAEKFNQPTILISENDDVCKGSGRSIPGFDLIETIEECREFLEDFGGHPMACGIKIKKENIKDFTSFYNKTVKLKLKKKNLERRLSVDCPLSIHAISEELIRRINKMAPFGIGNPEPTFATLNIELLGDSTIVGNNHLRFTVRDGNKHIPAIAFGQGEKEELLRRKSRVDIAYAPIIDNWSGKPILKVYDIK
ncbi:Single-stranded-DNA-specific exonuclease RecJ [subsurface metagenome]